MRILLLGHRTTLPRASGADHWGPTVHALRAAGHQVAWTDLPDGVDPMQIPLAGETLGDWLAGCDVAVATDGVNSAAGGMLRTTKQFRPTVRIAAWGVAPPGWDAAANLEELGAWLRDAVGVTLAAGRRSAPLDLCQHPGLTAPVPTALFAAPSVERNERGYHSKVRVAHPLRPGEEATAASDFSREGYAANATFATACARGDVAEARRLAGRVNFTERPTLILQAFRIMPAALAGEPAIVAFLAPRRQEADIDPAPEALGRYLLAHRATGRANDALRQAVVASFEGRDIRDSALGALATSLGLVGVAEIDLADDGAPALLAQADGWVSGFVREGSIERFCRQAVTAMRGRAGFWGLNDTTRSLTHAVMGHFMTAPDEQDALRGLLVDRNIPARARAAVARGIAEGWPLISADLLRAVIANTSRTWFLRTEAASLPMRTESPEAAGAILDDLCQANLLTRYQVTPDRASRSARRPQ